MRLRFWKMQGAGNDFVVLDATRAALMLTPEQARLLADRHFGIGADQILVVGVAPDAQADFSYRIFNASGEEVEHCGNGARCFLRFVRARGLATQPVVRVRTVNRLLLLRERDDGRVVVDMGAPVFDLQRIPFDATGLRSSGPAAEAPFGLWPLDLSDGSRAEVAVVSMGNPHAVQRVVDVDAAPVLQRGALIERHPRFPEGVNAGFMQVISRSQVRLRVFERGAGETLACGTGACAAVVAGIRMDWLDAEVDVQTRGGRLSILWDGAKDLAAPVMMSGPAEFVFEGEIEL